MAFGISLGDESSNTSVSGTKTTQKVFNQSAIDKLIYDIMSSDEGLAALASAENASGGYRSSGKTLLAQDLIAKVAGTIAQITAPTVETENKNTDTSKTNVGGEFKTVICTYLAEQGYMSLHLYLRAYSHNYLLHPAIHRGYMFWATGVVKRMRKSSRLCRFLSAIVRKRYEMIVDKKFSLVGAATIYIGHPICYVIGSFIPGKMTNGYQPSTN